jgi:hypothetical protein
VIRLSNGRVEAITLREMIRPARTMRAVRARSIAAVDPFVPTTSVWTGRRCMRWADMAAAGQTVAAWDLLVTALPRFRVIDATPAEGRRAGQLSA